MTGKLFNLFDESLRLITHCPICRVKYNPVEARVIEEGTDAHLVYVKCHSCGKAILAVVVEGGVGVQSIGMVTDLSSEDVRRLRRSRPVCGDDVLDLHELLQRQPALLDEL